MVTDVTVITPNPEVNADVVMNYCPLEMFEDNPVVLPYSFISNNRYIGCFVGKLSEKAINIPWLFYDAGCGLRVNVIRGEYSESVKKIVDSISSEVYVSEEINALLGEELMEFDETPYVEMIGFACSPISVNLSSRFVLITENLYNIEHGAFSNYVPDYNLVSTLSVLNATSHYAIVQHQPCPIVNKVLYYYAEKYADEGNYVRDSEAIQEMIRAAKLCNRYAKEARDYYTSRLIESGLNVMCDFDAPHMYVDDDNVFHFEAQPAKEDEVSIRLYGGQVYLFNGLGNEEWMNSVPGSTIFDKSVYYSFNLVDYVNTVSPSAELITNFTLE